MVPTSSFLRELFAASAADCIAKLLGQQRERTAMTPLYADKKITGILLFSCPQLHEKCVSVIKNLAHHISAAFTQAQRKSAHLALQRQLRVKACALDSAISGIAFSDMNGRITYANRAFADMWKLAGEKEACGKQIHDFWHDKEDAARTIKEICEQSVFEGEMKAARSDGTTFDVQLCANIFINADVVKL